jgi:hypothetical protein
VVRDEELRIPDKEEFKVNLFSPAENRIYMVAKKIVDSSWSQPSSMADGAGVLLYIWNRAFYQDGSTLDFDKLEECISRNSEVLQSFRNKSILGVATDDAEVIKKLFEDFMNALVGIEDKRGTVGVTKALHLLAPEFFPMWETQIAIDYGCTTSSKDVAEEYICFCKLIQEVAKEVKDYPNLPKDRTLVKLIDEYNHSTREVPKVIRKK